MFNQSIVLRGVLSVILALTFCVVAQAQTKRYALIGDDLAAAEASLAEMGVKKIKSFKHFNGLAVHLSHSQADTLRANLGTGLRLINDQPFQGFDDVEVAKGKPGGGGGKPGGSSGQQASWGINAVNAPSAWADPNFGTRGAGAAVCVVDTGFDMDHPDLAANIGGGGNYIDGGSWDDDNGHGTHVGGIIAAVDNSTGVLGVAPQATLLAAKAFNRRGIGAHGDVADALLGCLDLRDEYASGMPLVVNMSFNSQDANGFDAIVRPALLTVHNAGAILVGSSGNTGPSVAHILRRPAAYPEVFAIAGMNEDLTLWDGSSIGDNWFEGDPFSMPLKSPEFVAPASNILSLWKKGGTKTLDGTSMAAGFASGVVALGLSVNSLGPVGGDIGLITDKGKAIELIDAVLTVQNQGSNEAYAVPEPSSAALILAAFIGLSLIRHTGLSVREFNNKTTW